MVSRGRLKSGSTSVDLVSHDHVWAIVVYSVESVHKMSRNGSRGRARKENEKAEAVTELVQANLDEIDPTPYKSPQILLFKPSDSSLHDLNTIVLTWTPWVSMNVCKRIRSTPPKPRTEEEARIQARKKLPEPPHILLNIFDVAARLLPQSEPSDDGLEKDSSCSSVFNK